MVKSPNSNHSSFQTYFVLFLRKIPKLELEMVCALGKCQPEDLSTFLLVDVAINIIQNLKNIFGCIQCLAHTGIVL